MYGKKESIPLETFRSLFQFSVYFRMFSFLRQCMQIRSWWNDLLFMESICFWYWWKLFLHPEGKCFATLRFSSRVFQEKRNAAKEASLRSWENGEDSSDFPIWERSWAGKYLKKWKKWENVIKFEENYTFRWNEYRISRFGSFGVWGLGEETVCSLWVP